MLHYKRMFDNARRNMGAGPVPPPPIDPASLAGPRPEGQPGQMPQQSPSHSRYAPAPAPISRGEVQTPPQQEKDWGPWRPRQNQGYNPPDTPEEIEQVLSKYQGPPSGTGMGGGELPVMPQPKGSGRRWFVIIVIVFLALLVAAAVFAYMRFFSDNNNTNSANENTNVAINTNQGSPQQNVNTQTNTTVNATNTNQVSNLNTNTVFNANSNTNTAVSNTNQTSNTNVQTNSTANTNSQAKDTDGDGLTDFLEIIYGTDANNPDTDGDGFTDYNEIQAGFSPTQGGGAKL